MTWQTVYPFEIRQITLLFALVVTFSGFFSRWCSLSEFQHQGLFQPLCVWVSHVARRYRFASCKLLNSARCIRASESGICARSSLSSLCALQPWGSGELPKIECRANLTSVWHSSLQRGSLLMTVLIINPLNSFPAFKHLKCSND